MSIWSRLFQTPQRIIEEFEALPKYRIVHVVSKYDDGEIKKEYFRIEEKHWVRFGKIYEYISLSCNFFRDTLEEAKETLKWLQKYDKIETVETVITKD